MFMYVHICCIYISTYVDTVYFSRLYIPVLATLYFGCFLKNVELKRF